MTKQKLNHDGSLAIRLKQEIEKHGDKISKAERVRSLLQKQKKLWGKKQSLTDFNEPVMDLHRRNGQIETYEKATQGKFIFTHSNGQERYIELRPSDQCTRDYAGKKIRWYVCHEDRPFAGFENPVVDGESVMLGYEKTKATNLKYEEAIAKLKNKGKLAWLWILLGIALFIAIVLFAISNFAPDLWDRMFHTGKYAVQNGGQNVPTIGVILISLSKQYLNRGVALKYNG